MKKPYKIVSGLPRPLRRCLTTTNVIDSSHAGVRRQTNR